MQALFLHYTAHTLFPHCTHMHATTRPPPIHTAPAPPPLQVLFFIRLFADLFGRFLPRAKALQLQSPPLLLTLAATKVAVAVLLFVYIKAPLRLHNDVLSVLFIIFLWGAGGYINTSSNIMAPGLVHPALAARASAIMALTFQIAHFAGLVLAALLAFILYGDLV